MKWLMRAFYAAAGLLALFAAVGFVIPQRVSVQRAVYIDRPPTTVHAQIADLRSFAEWAPFLQRDPDAGLAFSGPDGGAGQRLGWSSSNAALGEGAVTITDAVSPSVVSMQVDLGRRGEALSVIEVTPREAGSSVRWTYRADFGANVAARYRRFGYDRALGADLEAGLSALRERAEALPAADFSNAAFEIVDAEPQPIAYASGRVRGDTAQHEAAFEAAVERVREFMEEAGLTQAGPVISITTRWEPPLWGFRAAIPYEGTAPAGGSAEVRFDTTYEGRAVRAVHRGDPRETATVYARMDAFMAANRLTQDGGPWEVFVTDRARGARNAQVTEIYVPIE